MSPEQLEIYNMACSLSMLQAMQIDLEYARKFIDDPSNQMTCAIADLLGVDEFCVAYFPQHRVFIATRVQFRKALPDKWTPELKMTRHHFFLIKCSNLELRDEVRFDYDFMHRMSADITTEHPFTQVHKKHPERYFTMDNDVANRQWVVLRTR